MKIEAVIFDLDGTMIDTESMSAKAVQAFVAYLGYDSTNIEQWYYENCIGMGSERIFGKMNERIKFDESKESIILKFRDFRADYFANTPVPVKKGLVKLLDYLKKQKIKMAIYTGTWLDQIYVKMKSANMPLDDFDAIVGGDMVKKHKPDPEGYFLACQKLGVKPENTVVIEDSDPGAEAAITGGMRVIMVPDIKENSKYVKENAWRFVKSLDKIVPIIEKENAEKPAVTTYCDYIDALPEGERRELHKNYHDNYYGFPIHDDNELFGRLVLEINQAGLSWETILKKQNAFRKAFDNYDIKRVASYGESDIVRLLSDSGIIRNRLKINAVIHNANVVLGLQKKYGSFEKWLNDNHPLTKDEWVKVFKKHFKFVGGEIVNEFLTSIGYLKALHREDCPVYKKILNSNPKWRDSK